MTSAEREKPRPCRPCLLYTSLFDLLGRMGSREAVAQAGAYLSSALYRLSVEK